MPHTGQRHLPVAWGGWRVPPVVRVGRTPHRPPRNPHCQGTPAETSSEEPVLTVDDVAGRRRGWGRTALCGTAEARRAWGRVGAQVQAHAPARLPREPAARSWATTELACRPHARPAEAGCARRGCAEPPERALRRRAHGCPPLALDGARAGQQLLGPPGQRQRRGLRRRWRSSPGLVRGAGRCLRRGFHHCLEVLFQSLPRQRLRCCNRRHGNCLELPFECCP
mmetsp:Transcript_75367/g.238230  ORF Transcript_75367/g.238230 Transcript_75367/m.238230 type:complete len:224 (-) Transcript_75367:104-775(-)